MRNVALYGITSPAEESAADRSDRRMQEVVRRERPRLFDFIRRRLPTREDAEDLVQEVLTDWVEVERVAEASDRLTQPIEHLAGWLFTVARRKIIDWYRKKRPVSLEEQAVGFSEAEGEPLLLAELLPSHQRSAEESLMQEAIMDALTIALDELPPEQREAFIGHELEGQSFRDMADETGVSVNTLLSRKRYAVLYLRERLRDLYDEWNAN